ncbi:hypothetical protein A306_00000460 [Columba livia]|uniref:Peptidase S1 domain-containing protein n=1 Tax=Columba livia TaxID=8932 RepID=A0A2I0LGK1_COLLI|nr:hypothetical protein A306_00000460 [Columba livia]
MVLPWSTRQPHQGPSMDLPWFHNHQRPHQGLFSTVWTFHGATSTRGPHRALLSPSSIPIRMGDHSLKTKEGTEQCVNSAKAFVHPNYDPTSHDSDIMLLKPPTPPPPAMTATSCSSSSRSPCTSPSTSSRWPCPSVVHPPTPSASSQAGGAPAALKCGLVYTISNEECAKLYPKGITKNMLCAGATAGGTDSCQEKNLGDGGDVTWC